MLVKLIKKWVIHYPKIIVSFTLLLGMLVAPSLTQIKNDPSPHLLSPSHPTRQAMVALREDFTGANPGIFIMLETENTIFKPTTLKRVQDLTQAIEGMSLISEDDLQTLKNLIEQIPGSAGEQLLKAIPKNANELDEIFWMEINDVRDSLSSEGLWKETWNSTLQNLEVRAGPVNKVTSLGNTDDILGTKDGLSIEPIFESVPSSKEEMQRLKTQVLKNDLFRNSLYSQDGLRTGIFVELTMSEDDTVNLNDTYIALEQIFVENPGTEKHYIAGFPIIAATLRTVVDKDTKLFFPFVALLATFFLWLTFRRAIGVAVPMLVVGFSILFTMAIMVFFEIPLNTITSALPVFLISIGVADGIHMFSAYREHRLEGYDQEKSVSMMLDKLAIPVIMTSVTTAVGFFSLTISDIVPILTFGVFIAIGTLLAMVLSLLFIPALLILLPDKNSNQEKENPAALKNEKAAHQENFMDRIFQSFLDALTGWVLRNAKTILFGALVISGVSIYGLMQVEVESNLGSYFSEDASFVVANKAMGKMSGTRTVNILIKADEENEPWKKPEYLKLVADFQNQLETESAIKRTFSLVDLIKRISYAFNENRPEFNRLPTSQETIESLETYEENGEILTRKLTHQVNGRDLVAQYLVLYENSGGDVLSDVVDSEYTTLNLTVNISSNSTQVEQGLLKRIEKYAQEIFPPKFEIKSVGVIPINVATSNEVVSSQVRSLLGSMLVVMLMLILIFRSIKRGLLGMIPLFFTVLFNFGIMGYFGVYLDIGTALVSSIVIGIGVDYSIHYLSRMFREHSLGNSLNEAISNTVRSSGKAITSNAVTVGFGFLALSVSEFLPLVTLSWMIWLTLNISALATMILVPAFAITFPKSLKLQNVS